MPPSDPEGTRPDSTIQRIAADLERHLGRRVLDLEPMAEGHSGLTYRVQLEGQQGILRLPAAGVRIAGPSDVARQGRIIPSQIAAITTVWRSF